ncbi:MAG: hypothetical protein ACKOC5_04140 [Chloroflexota bacterium]
MKSLLERIKKPLLWAGAACLAAAGLKFWLQTAGRLPFNSDEAVVALMARHILQGARPVFFYGQAYMGSLDAALVALGFALFGQQVWVIRLVQGLLYLGVLLTTGRLGQKIFGSAAAGALAMLLLALPAVNVTLYTTVSLGGYNEALLLGNLILLSALRLGGELRQGRPGGLGEWLLLGGLSGLGLWAFGLALVYSAAAGIYLLALAPVGRGGPGLRRLAPAGAALLAGGLLGALPWVWYAVRSGPAQLLFELGGGAIAGVEQLPWIFQVGRHLAGFLLLGVTVTLGFRPPWSADWLGLPLLPFVLILWMALLGAGLRRLRRDPQALPAESLLWLMAAVLVGAFILTPFGADPSGRYFVPLAVPLALIAAAGLLQWRERIGGWAWGLAGLLLVYHAWGTLQVVRQNPPGITTQFYAPSQVDMRAIGELERFLRANDERFGYTNYWTAYPLAFLSGEDLIYTPRLPYHLDFSHTERDNRYAPYNARVAAAPHPAYITTNFPELDARLRQGLAALGVSWQEAQIGDFQVFYRLSRAVTAEELGFGVNYP